MEFLLLGPVEVRDSGSAVWLGGRRERTILAVLLLAAGRLVPLDRLIDSVWGDRPPATARRQVHTGMSMLRRVLGDRLVTCDPGYRLATDLDDVDLRAFDLQVRQARQAAGQGRTGEAADDLRSALRLWRGPALGSVTGLTGDAARLEEERLTVLAERIDLDLALGRHTELVGELSGLVGEHPLRERFRAQLMLALYRCGRRAEALQAFQDARRALAEDLGLEPPEELSRLERSIVAADPKLDLARPGATPAPGPCLLPADPADFTGRSRQVEQLCEVLTADDRKVAICAIAGRGGVGKTALAVHVAHRLREVFDGGQLYVDLRGGSTQPAEPPEVLGRFLRALGVAGSSVPAGLDERAELYRDLAARRRLLVVLDNARDEAQVSALLPGAAGSGVLVTSRARLGGLAGARLVELDVLDQHSALRLLDRVAGCGRVDAEPPAAAELVQLCERLPLAVRIAGAKLASRPHWRLAELVDRMAGEQDRLDELVHGGLAVRASLGLSYQGLDAEPRRLLRRLGLLEAPDFTPWVCAALLDTSTARARDLAERLVDARLLQVCGWHRYRFHDLVRCFARERGEAEEPPVDRAAALDRVWGAWLAIAERAHRACYGGDDVIIHGSSPRWVPDGVDELVADPHGWLDAERIALVAAVRQAAGLGHDEVAWDLALSGIALFATRWYLDEWRQTHEYALAATLAAGNLRGEAAIRYGLGALDDAHCRYEPALRRFERAAALFEAIGERKGHGLATVYLSHIARRLGRFELALTAAASGRAVTREVGDRAGEASALRSTAQTRLALGELDAVEQPLTEALAILTATGNRRDQAQVLRDLGELHLRRGSIREAQLAFGRVLGAVRELGDRTGESFALLGLGECHLRQRHFGLARVRLAEALRLAKGGGTRFIEARILAAHGELAYAQGRPDRAIERFGESAALCGEIGSPLWQARALHRLGDAQDDAGDHESARSSWRRAMALFTAVGAPEARQPVPR